MMKFQSTLTATALVMGMALLAGCNQEPVDDIDRVDAEPAARVSDDAIGTPADEDALPSGTTDNMQDDEEY